VREVRAERLGDGMPTAHGGGRVGAFYTAARRSVHGRSPEFGAAVGGVEGRTDTMDRFMFLLDRCPRARSLVSDISSVGWEVTVLDVACSVGNRHICHVGWPWPRCVVPRLVFPHHHHLKGIRRTFYGRWWHCQVRGRHIALLYRARASSRNLLQDNAAFSLTDATPWFIFPAIFPGGLIPRPVRPLGPDPAADRDRDRGHGGREGNGLSVITT
jgi:hypothetical protein